MSLDRIRLAIIVLLRRGSLLESAAVAVCNVVASAVLDLSASLREMYQHLASQIASPGIRLLKPISANEQIWISRGNRIADDDVHFGLDKRCVNCSAQAKMRTHRRSSASHPLRSRSSSRSRVYGRDLVLTFWIW